MGLKNTQKYYKNCTNNGFGLIPFWTYSFAVGNFPSNLRVKFIFLGKPIWYVEESYIWWAVCRGLYCINPCIPAEQI